MKEFSNIVIPIDFHEHSQALAAYGLYLGEQFAARVTFIHVAKQLPDYTDFKNESQRQLEKECFAQAESRMVEFLQTLQAKGHACGGDVLKGLVSEAIVNYAQDTHADLLVISSHGPRKQGRNHLGSVTQRVVERAPCPILVLHPDEQERGYEVCHPLNSCISSV